MTDTNVVSIRQSASFLHSRAMKQKREGNYLEALELLRRAAEQPGGRGDCWLDMAAVYEDMHCYAESRKMALLQLLHTPERTECLHWLGHYDEKLGDLDEACRAYSWYLYRERDGRYAEEALHALNEIQMGMDMWKQADRRMMRHIRLMRQAKFCQFRMDYEAAERIFEKEAQSLPGEPQLLINRAMNQMMMGQQEQARKTIDSVESYSGEMPGIVILAAQVYSRLGDARRAAELINSLNFAEAAPWDMQLVFALLTEMGKAQQAYDLGRNLLREDPYDRHLLHLMAVNAVRLHLPAETAEGYWQRIVRMYPEDDVARWLIAGLRSGELNAENLEEVYQLPHAEMMRRSQQLLSYLYMPAEILREMWQTDAEFRHILQWAVFTDVVPVVKPAVQLLDMLDLDSARELLMRFAAENRMNPEFEAIVTDALTASDGTPNAGLKEYLKLRGVATNFEQMLVGLCVSHRQMLKAAQERLKEDFSLEADAELNALWRKLLEQGCGEWLQDWRSGAAALTLLILHRNEKRVPPELVAQKFECGMRKMKYYTKRMLWAWGSGGRK